MSSSKDRPQIGVKNVIIAELSKEEAEAYLSGPEAYNQWRKMNPDPIRKIISKDRK